jgi:MFS family permease
MQGLAQGWLILVLVDPQLRASVMGHHHGDAAALTSSHLSAVAQASANYWSGVVNFAGGLPLLLLSLFAGVLIDRVNKRYLLVLTQLLMGVSACVLGFLIKFQMVTIDWVVFMALMLGIVMAFDMPTRQSFVARLVAREDMSSAVVLNSSMFNSARALGPAVAGYLLAAHVSIADCFFLNGISYIAVIIALLMMRGPRLGEPIAIPPDQREESMWAQMKEGFAFVRGHHTMRNIIILVGSFGTY